MSAAVKLRRAAPWLAAAYAVFMALTAFWPTPVDQSAHDTITHIIRVLHKHGVPQQFNYALVEFCANIALFVPAGFLIVVYMGMERWWCGFVAGFALSTVIELTQLAVLPDRFPSVADVVSNTTGAIFGTVLALALLSRWERAHR